MATVTLTNTAGYKHRTPMTTSPVAVSVVPSANKKGGGRVQLVANVVWWYSHVDEGATEDNWLVVPASAAITFDSGSRALVLYARTATGSANLHILEL